MAVPSAPSGLPAEDSLNTTQQPNTVEVGNAQGGPVFPPYEWEVKEQFGKTFYRSIRPLNIIESTGILNDLRDQFWNIWPGSIDSFRADKGADIVWPSVLAPIEERNPIQTTNNQTTNNNGSLPDDVNPFDPRLVFITETDGTQDRIVYSYTADPQYTAPLVEGFVFAENGGKSLTKDGGTRPVAMQDAKLSPTDIYNNTFGNADQFRGVPAMMSNMAYINFIASGGAAKNSDGLKVLVDRENQPRWYDLTSGRQKTQADGTPVSTTQDLTVSDIVKWAQQDGNKKFPYRYQDFVFCKWYKKIPLNYMITLRRYTRPVLDNVTSEFDSEFIGGEKESKLRSAAHAITYLGEEPGNKMSSILGPIEAGLLWKEFKADVWEIQQNGQPAQADSPFPNLARTLGFLNKGAEGARNSAEPVEPPDPYNGGPYANKIYGPVTVIDNVKGRDRGITFSHNINLQFDYSGRSIGGINTKAIMLDIIGNLMILTFNTAAFWGGENRMMPYAAGGSLAPFLGGEDGRRAWLEGNPASFFDSVANQFASAVGNLGDLFNKIMDDPINGLKQIAGGAMSSYMKLNTTRGKVSTHQLHALLTGAPVGEWHITVGNPMNPMMLIGNLICTKVKIEFNDELGPDDFPTELKATITLEHAMPRDKTAIESMFNKGGGRLYSLPPGMQGVDLEVASATESHPGKENEKGDKGKGTNPNKSNPLLGDPTQVDRIITTGRTVAPRVANTAVAVYNHGYATFNNPKQPAPTPST